MINFHNIYRAIQKIFLIFCMIFIANSAFAACASSEIDVSGNGSICQPTKFTLYTSSTNSFQFKLSAAGTFYVDCGNGGTLSGSGVSGNAITRDGTNEDTYACSWSNSATRVIRFGGEATDYSADDLTAAIRFNITGNSTDTNAEKISSISGDLSAIFPYITSNSQSGAQPRFNNLFRGAQNLTSVSNTLFANYTTPATNMFVNAFTNCQSLAYVPAGLFLNITGSASGLFRGTFADCTGLKSIPKALFTKVSGGAARMFESTFSGCTSLTAIPENLFAGVSSAAEKMFYSTFYECGGLEGYIPKSTFVGLIANGHPTATDMWNATFADTGLAETCPSTTKQIITGYESAWDGKVSCVTTNAIEIRLEPEGGDVASTIYLAYGDSWYSDADMIDSITVLSPLPTRSGYTFKGYFTGRNGSGTQIIAENGTLLTTPAVLEFTAVTPTNIYAYWIQESTISYACGEGSGTAPANKTVIRGTEFAPAANTCSKPGYLFTGWKVSGTDDVVSNTFTWNYTGNKTLTAQWAEEKFSLTTYSTNFLHFKMSAAGTFYVDCGNGGVLEGPNGELPGKTITRTGTTEESYLCHWSGSEAQTIKFGGTATNYATGVTKAAIRFDEDAQDIASISGNLSAMFPYKTSNPKSGAQPRFYRTFYGATNLGDIPGTLFADYTTPSTGMFYGTFQNCSSLTSVPARLFSEISGSADSLFSYTFDGCTDLQLIPENLFASISGGAPSLFYYTFNNCTSLTAMPENLFAGVTEAESAMFMNTFSGCTSLTGYIPPSTFAGLIANGHPVASSMWLDTFTNTNLAMSCAASGVTAYTTGYEGGTNGTTWNGRVSCRPANLVQVFLEPEGGNVASMVYLAYGEGWYSDENMTTPITTLSAIPEKNGYAFNGYFSEQNGSGIQIVDANGVFLTTTTALEFASITPTSIYASWLQQSTISYSCGEGTGTAPAGRTVVKGTSFTPAENTCSKSGYLFTGWKVSGTADVVNGAFTWNYTGNKTLTAQWTEERFRLSVASTNSFQFKLSAAGTFYVDCGNGGTLSGSGVSGNAITRDGTNEDTYACSWSNSATRVIRFGGEATDYSADDLTAAIRFNITGNSTDTNAAKISFVSGYLSAIFPYITSNSQSGAQPRFNNLFRGAQNLSYVPDTLFSDYTTPATNMFVDAFTNCQGLESVPSDLFSNITGSASGLFRGTFADCTGLASIPEDLFEKVSGGAARMFESTFSGCTSLTAIPESLFAGVSSAAGNMFYSTFYECGDLEGYIPPSTFAGLIANGHPTATDMWNTTFADTGLAETCPNGTKQVTTGYESAWDGKVACVTVNVLEVRLEPEGGDVASIIYLAYGDSWYSDADMIDSITVLSPLPTRSGYTFKGYFTGRNGSGTQIIAENGTLLTTPAVLEFTSVTPTTIYAYWQATCPTGYSLTANGCVANRIDIAWGGVQSPELLPNDVRSTSYNGNIQTPVVSDLAAKSGFVFKGWAFRRPTD